MNKIIVFFVMFTIIQTTCAELVEYDSCKDITNLPLSSHVQSSQNNDSLKILFIGSSYFNYNNLPDLFENIVINSVKEIFVDRYGTNGMFLSDHASSYLTRSKICEHDWDFIILQGVGRNMAYPYYFTDHPVYPSLVTLNEIIHQNCESTKMIYCMPWAFEDGMTWYQDWTDTYEDMQLKIFNTTINYSNDIGFIIAPVGWTWYRILEENDYPLHYLHMSDWNHPSLKGSYLMACVLFSTVYIEPSINNSYYASLDEHEANYFQTIASDIVLNNLSLWNIESQDNNSPPYKPEKPSGPTSIRKNVLYTFSSSTTDADGDMLYYLFDWGDGNSSGWIGPYDSGDLVEANHSWMEKGKYSIRVKAQDVHGIQSDWSEALSISFVKDKFLCKFNFRDSLEFIRLKYKLINREI